MYGVPLRMASTSRCFSKPFHAGWPLISAAAIAIYCKVNVGRGNPGKYTLLQQALPVVLAA